MTEFSDLNAFVTIITPLLNTVETPNLSGLVASFNGINSGCKCTRDNRVNATNGIYNELGSKLIDSEKTLLKEKFPAPIIAKSGGNEIWRLE